MNALWLMLAAGAAFGQAPDRDARNVDVPDTDTHFQMRRYESLARWESRRAELRRQILFAAGLDPVPLRTPLRPEVFGRLERDGYTVEKVLLETLPGYWLGGNLYLPRGGSGPRPAVLTPHGHWTYGRLEHQPLTSNQTLAANLARLGIVVFAYDMAGYNDTGQTPHGFGGPRERLWGFGPLGLQLWNSIRALDFVESLPEVDKSRIGVTGASGGGTQSFLLSAVDPRVAAAAPVNMVSAIMQGGCVCENAPGLRHGTCNVEIAAMTAPRPMLLVSATGDWTRNVPREEFPAIREIYGLYGRPENVEAVQFDAPHNYHGPSREAVLRFFAGRLLGRTDAGEINEREIAIEQLQDLLAWHGRSRPSNALDFEGVFRFWRHSAESQAVAASADALREALELAVKARWPERVESQAAGEAVVLWRPDAGDRIPGVWIPGQGRPALIIHPEGAEGARGTAAAQGRIRAGRPVLLIDAFQTGKARAPRDTSHQHFLTFNLSDDAHRVQDILTAAAFLRSRQPGPVEVVGMDRAGIWALFAAALSPPEISLAADLDWFKGSDGDYLRYFPVPGIRRAGGLDAALFLTEGRRRRD